MADFMDMFWRAPPISRTIVAGMFFESALVYSQLLGYHRIIFYIPWLFKFPPELWRLVTCFLLTGPNINFVFDLYFMWTYSSGLELNSPRFTQPGDFFTYVFFLAAAIWVLAGYVLQATIFTSALMLAFIYTFAQDNRGKKAHFIILQIPVELLPWFMLGLTLIFGGPLATMQQGTGVVAAHLYDFLTRLYPTFQGGKNYIRTPAIVRRYFAPEQGTYTQKAYGSTYRSGQQPPQTQSRGWTSGISNPWSARGTGRRLGGD